MDTYFDNPLENYNNGVYHYQKVEFDVVLVFFKAYLLKELVFINVLYAHDLIYCQLEDYDRAMKEIDKAIEIDESYQRFWVLKAVCYSENYNKKKAVKCFNKVCELNPNDMLVWIDKAIFYVNDRDYNEASNFYDGALKISNGNPAPLFL